MNEELTAAAIEIVGQLEAIALTMEREQERQDGELVLRYLSDTARWNDAVKQCAVPGFDLLTHGEQEYRTERRDDLRQALNHFMIAYPWIVARVEGKDVTTGPITTQEGDFCLSCGTNTRPDGSCECDGWEADE